jgi:hypothetical protein
MNMSYIGKILLVLLVLSSVYIHGKEPKLLATMRIGPLTEMANKASKFSSKISKSLTALPHIALIGLSFSKDFRAMDLNSTIKVYFYSVEGKSSRRIAWLTFFEMNPGFGKRIPGKIKWLKGKKAYIRRFNGGILVAENRALLQRVSKLPPCNEGNKSQISIKFNSAEYLKNNRHDFIALRNSYLDKTAIKRMTKDFGPVIADAIVSRIDDLEYVMSQSRETLVTLDIEPDAVLVAIKAKPAANTKLAAFVNAQKKVTGAAPALPSGHTVAFRGNIFLTPELRKAMSGLGKAENFLMPFAAEKRAASKVAPLLTECISGRFSWFADKKRKIPAVGASFYKSELKASSLMRFAGLKKTSATDIYRIAEYAAKNKRCSVFLKPQDGLASFAVGSLTSKQANTLMNTRLVSDKQPVPVYGELHLKNGDKSAAVSGDFENDDLNLKLRLFPNFAKYFVSGKPGRKGKRRIRIDIRKIIKR